jgi:hypothetical protein
MEWLDMISWSTDEKSHFQAENDLTHLAHLHLEARKMSMT